MELLALVLVGLGSPDPEPFTQSEYVREIEERVEEVMSAVEAETEPEAEVQEVEPQPEPPPELVEEVREPLVPSGVVGEPWQSLADCESGNWIDGGASFERESARWYWAKPGTEVPPWGTTIHHGGLQFHPGTWSAYRSDHHPTYAYDATPAQQVEVAQRVQASQGWGAWPVCSQKVGLR